MNSEDLFAKWEEERKWKEAHPLQAFPGEAFDFFRYVIPRTINDAWYQVKWGFQRMFRGFDDRMLWGYSTENAQQTLKVLKWLQKNKHCAPFTHDPDGVISITEEETKGDTPWDLNKKHFDRWNKCLGLITAGFEAYLAEDYVHLLDENGKYDHEKSQIERERLHKKWEIGSKLFIANYGGLWD